MGERVAGRAAVTADAAVGVRREREDGGEREGEEVGADDPQEEGGEEGAVQEDREDGEVEGEARRRRAVEPLVRAVVLRASKRESAS